MLISASLVDQPFSAWLQSQNRSPFGEKSTWENRDPVYNYFMRWVTGSLAALLSLLLVSAPVSAWACDVSCSSHEAHSDCHASATTSKNDTAMSMPPGMDMGSDQSESPTGSDTVMGAVPGHSMAMSPQQEMATRRFEQATKPATRTGTVHAHSKGISSCTHETCSQVSTSASPPGADHSEPNSLHWMAVSISSPLSLLVGFHWVRFRTPLPKLLTADRLIRI